jgi:hypothetical protein
MRKHLMELNPKASNLAAKEDACLLGCSAV